MEELLLVLRGAPATVDDELAPSSAASVAAWRNAPRRAGIELGYTRDLVVEGRRAVGDSTVGRAEAETLVVMDRRAVGDRRVRLVARGGTLTARDVDGWLDRRGQGRRRRRRRRQLVAKGRGDQRDADEQTGDTELADPDRTGRSSCWLAVGHPSSLDSGVLPARMRFSICRRYVPASPGPLSGAVCDPGEDVVAP
jgi:hypothetical protein